MKLINRILPFLIVFAFGCGLSAFARNVDVAEAIGLSVIITGAVLFIGALLILACFGAWIFWLAANDGLETAIDALKREGMMRESQ